MKQFELGHLYYYAPPDGESYLIRIFAVGICDVDDVAYRVQYYNTKFKNRGHNDMSKRSLDRALNSPEHIFRELNRAENAKALLLGL